MFNILELPPCIDIARTNGREITTEQQKEMRSILNKIEDKAEDSLDPRDMFKPDHIKKTLVLLLSWYLNHGLCSINCYKFFDNANYVLFRITVCVGYYALTLSTTKLNGDILLNYLYGTIADSPGEQSLQILRRSALCDF